MTAPFWALTASYWLHMLATVAWIGGLAVMAIIVLPAASSALSSSEYAAFLDKVQKRLDPLAWFSLIVLVGTGMVQMSSNPNYEGFLAIENTWGIAILAKHLVIGGMVLISAYTTWGLMPALGRAALRRARGQEDDDAGQLRKREAALLRLNLALGIIVLALTALARAS